MKKIYLLISFLEVLIIVEEIKFLVFEYILFDIFNMNDTCIFYRIKPNYMLALKRLFEKIEKKKHIIIALITNIDGTIKLLLIINM